MGAEQSSGGGGADQAGSVGAPPAPRSSPGILSFSQPSAPAEPGKTDSSSASVGPGERKPVQDAILAKEQEVLRSAWCKLQSEFQVQVKVWESVAQVAGSSSSAVSSSDVEQVAKRESAASMVRAALEASSADPEGAIKLLRPLTQGGGGKALGQATSAALHGVNKAGRQAQLLSRLAAAAAPQAPAPTDAQRTELESAVEGARLGDALESRVRKVLGLAPSQKEIAEQAKAEKVVARQIKAAEAQAYQARIDRLAKAAGVNGEKARLALASANNDVDTAMVMLLSEVQAQQQKKNEKAASEAQAREKEMLEVAAALESLASKTPRLAWEQVRAEFQIQLEIWNTQSLLAASTSSRGMSFQDSKAEVEGALESAKNNPDEAVLLLELALQNATDRRLELCAGVLAAADRVLDAERMAESRRGLASRLKATSKEGAGGDPYVKQLLAGCDLGSSPLGRRVQKILDGRTTSNSEDRRVKL